MRKRLKSIKEKMSVRQLNPIVAFFLINLFFIVLKTFIEYQISFTLNITGPLQTLIALINPIPTALIFLSIGLYFKGYWSYWLIWLANLLQTIWLFSNMLYYREFSDYLSVSIIGSSSSVGENLGKSIMGIIQITDFIVFLDVVVLAILLLTKQIKSEKRALPKKRAGLTTLLGVVLIVVNYGVASFDRSGLLTRSFDNNYLVKYLGLNEYIAVNAYQVYEQAQTRKEANEKQIKPVKDWINENRVPANVSYYGTQKGKNVIAFHLESFQQFLIDYKVNGEEVTPNLNAFFHNDNTLSFDNFYHQVGIGKTSDAETMLDNSLFGLPNGSAMIKYGTNNTFQSTPAILKNMGYSTASLHGDVPGFWNRNNAYKSWGYDYYFSKDFYPNAKKKEMNLGYGMLDKVFLKDSVKYLEQLPQPFYAKLITVTNHYPYLTNGEMKYSFPKLQTGDSTVDPYVQTAHYVDEAFAEFIQWMKDTGLYENSLIYVYGDHYGISENHPDAIAQIFGKTPEELTDYDLTQFQKVPFMIHATGLKGGINHTYGGEIDVVPTLMDLLGVADSQYVFFGHDLLSDKNRQIVAFRNGDWVTSQILKKGDRYFNTADGQEIETKSMTKEQKKLVSDIQKYVDNQLKLSDKTVMGDLLRFDDAGRVPLDKTTISYTKDDTLASLKDKLRNQPSSLRAKNGGQTTEDRYNTSELAYMKKDDLKAKVEEMRRIFEQKYPEFASSDK